ncbi:MAG: hypothetical protein ACKPKO_37360, partial [Candidatus Fonsibacter sp.]
MPNEKKYDVEELLDKTRDILKEDAEAEFPQYAARIANTLTTQHAVEYLVHNNQQEEYKEPPQERPSQSDASKLDQQAAIDAALK